jgi:acyl dehydratase
MIEAQHRSATPAGGRFLEDLRPGAVFRSRMGRTITDADNVWFTGITHNSNQVHFNREYAATTRFGRELVNSCFVLSLVTGLTVADTSENAIANLGWDQVRLPRPVFVGDTVWAESQILAVRESRTQRRVGIVTMRSRGINQRTEVVIEFRRTFMIGSRSDRGDGVFPETETSWGV